MRKLIFFAVLIILGCGALKAQSTDPFYTNLFNTGISKLKTGNFEEAYKDIRVASFGFIDNKEMLAESYMALVVASFKLEDIKRINNFCTRLEEMGYGDHTGNIDPYIRREFDEFLKWQEQREKPEEEETRMEEEAGEEKDGTEKTISRKDELIEKNRTSGLNMDEIRELAGIYHSEGDLGEIYSLLEPISKRIGDRPALMLYLAESQYEQKRYGDSRRSLEIYNNAQKDKDDIYYWLSANMHIREKRYSKAERDILSIRDKDAFEEYEGLLSKIKANTETEKKEETADSPELDKMIENGDYSAIIDYLEDSPYLKDAEYGYVLAGAYFQKQQFKDCIDTVKKIRISEMEEKDRVKIYYYLGICYINMDDRDQGCRYLETAYRGRSMLNRVEAENAVRNLVEADCISYTDIVREYNKNRNDHLNILAIALAEYRNRRYEQSLEYFSAIKRKDDGHLYANYYMGINNYYLGNYTDAISCFERLIESGHRFEALYFRLGSAYYSAGNYEKAYEYLDRIYDRYKNSESFMKIYSDAKDQTGR